MPKSREMAPVRIATHLGRELVEGTDLLGWSGMVFQIAGIWYLAGS
jgi:hypothetical protein